MSRRFRRFPSRQLIFAGMLLVLFASRWGCDGAWQRDHLSSAETLTEGVCRVVRVIDGDTIIVQQIVQQEVAGSDSSSAPRYQQARVRLLGMDTPETVKPNHPVEPFGKQATAFTKSFLAKGQVYLRLDKRRIDRYDRLLAYVYVEEAMLNEELLRAGLARVSIYPGDSPTMSRLLRKAEKEAQSAARGIWSHTQQ